MAHPITIERTTQFTSPIPTWEPGEPITKAVARHLLRRFRGPLPAEVLCACLLAIRAYNSGDFCRPISFPRAFEHPVYGPSEPAYIVIGRWDLTHFVPPMPGSEA